MHNDITIAQHLAGFFELIYRKTNSISLLETCRTMPSEILRGFSRSSMEAVLIQRHLRKMINAYETLSSFLKSGCEATAEEVMVTPQFKNLLMSFFESSRILTEGRNRTAVWHGTKAENNGWDEAKSEAILVKSEQRVDILKIVIPRLQQLLKGIWERIKKQGFCDWKHGLIENTVFKRFTWILY